MLYTASLNRRAAQHGLVLDCTVKSASTADRCLAPTWELVLGSKQGRLTWPQYVEGYLALLRVRWHTIPSARRRLEQLVQLASTGDVTLCCYCQDPQHCHRSLLAEVLQKIARSQGVELQTTIR